MKLSNVNIDGVPFEIVNFDNSEGVLSPKEKLKADRQVRNIADIRKVLESGPLKVISASMVDKRMSFGDAIETTVITDKVSFRSVSKSFARNFVETCIVCKDDIAENKFAITIECVDYGDGDKVFYNILPE